MNGSKILVVDDEPEMTELITLYLRREGFRVYAAHDGAEALAAAGELKPDLIVLDVLLNSVDGISICKSIRERSDVPILFLSCKSDDTDIIHGLSVGGDDYITKPFSPAQLVARIKAHLRRAALAERHAQESSGTLICGGLRIDLAGHAVTLDEREIPLSLKEYELLLFLARSPNRAFPLDELYENVWGTGSMGDTRTLMVHISNLRKKIERDPAKPSYIVTVRGVGYKFAAKEGTSYVHC